MAVVGRGSRVRGGVDGVCVADAVGAGHRRGALDLSLNFVPAQVGLASCWSSWVDIYSRGLWVLSRIV